MVKFRPLLDVMTIDRFGFDVEFLFVAKYHGLRLKEIPVRWNNVEGSKVSVFRDTGRMITELSQIRRNSKRRLRFKMTARLNVNIDHVATVREARKTIEPSVIAAAVICEQAGAHGITVHLRGDRRHIQDRDIDCCARQSRLI